MEGRHNLYFSSNFYMFDSFFFLCIDCLIIFNYVLLDSEIIPCLCFSIRFDLAAYGFHD